MGADASPQGAAAEARRAAEALGVRATIDRCGNWFHTVAVVPNKEQALDLLSRAQTRSPYNPYFVELASWCPGKQPGVEQGPKAPYFNHLRLPLHLPVSGQECRNQQ